jgi:phosphate transport system substrate-binding protein
VKLKRLGITAGLALTATLALAACGSDNNTTTPGGGSSSSAANKINCASGKLTAQGSSAQANAMDQWVKAYQNQCSGAEINYNGTTGSGAGVQAFIAGTADFAGSDSALKDGDEHTKANARCKTGNAIDLPMVTGPIAVAYNLDGVKDLQLKPATIAKIFAGTVKTWDAAEIKADNPSATLPSTPILAIHRSDSSGTSDNFTKFLAATAKSDWTFGNDKAWKAPGGQGEKGSDGVSGAIKKSAGAIGYVEFSFAQNNSLSMAKVGNGNGEFAALTGESASKTVAGASVVGTGNDLSLKIDYNTKEAGAYPIVLVTYEIVCEKGSPSDKLALLKSFLTYTVSTDAQAGLKDIGYAPLPDSVRTEVEAAVTALA